MRSLALAFLLLLTGCTTSIGGISVKPNPWAMEFGDLRTLHVCALRDPWVPQEQVQALLAAWQGELAPFGIVLDVPWIRDWERPAFTAQGIAEYLATLSLDVPGDRVEMSCSLDLPCGRSL